MAGDDEPSLDDAFGVYLERDRPIIERAVEEAIESEEPFDVELRYRRSGEAIRWLRVQGVPIVEDGDVVLIRGGQHRTSPTERSTSARSATCSR